MDAQPVGRRSRSRYLLAIWLFAVWNAIALLAAVCAVLGVFYPPRDSDEFWMLAVGFPAVGAFAMGCLLFSAARESRLAPERGEP